MPRTPTILQRSWWLSVCVLAYAELSLAQAQKSGGGGQQQDYSTSKSEWSEWLEWSSCTRSCGGGISKRSRSCRRPIEGSRYFQILEHFDCVGLYEEYQSCNLQDCPFGSQEFREAQCSEYDEVQFMGRLYTWEPFLEAPNRCELNCRARGQRFYVKQADKVIDGTSCGSDSSTEICVNGQCKSLGCDGILNSDKTYDNCGICGGDNSQCRLVREKFSVHRLPVGYNLIVQIPAGAREINITETEKSRNYIALKSHQGKGYINSDWTITTPGDYSAAGTTFRYRRPRSPTTNKGEYLYSRGPTNEDLDVMLIYQQRNPGISYEYVLPISNGDTLHGQTKKIAEEQHSTEEKMVDENVDVDTSRESPPANDYQYDPSYSSGVQGLYTAPPSYQQHQGPERQGSSIERTQHYYDQAGFHAGVNYVWRETRYTDCSHTCAGGVQQTVVECFEENGLTPVAASYCHSSQKTQSRMRACNVNPCPARWEVSEWSECSHTCGEGMRMREVMCKQRMSKNIDQMVATSQCQLGEQPQSKRKCATKSCTHWAAGEWQECSVKCGVGQKQREVSCVDGPGTMVENSQCSSEDKPDASESCEMGFCDTDWYFSAWSESCSAECGEGEQERQVYCTNGLRVFPDSQCSIASQKPSQTQSCRGHSCSTQWFTSEWSQCSAECGLGRWRRRVLCIDSEDPPNVVPEPLCSQLDQTRPEKEETCKIKDCESRWIHNEWSECTRTCGTGTTRRDVLCLDQNDHMSNDCAPATRPLQRKSCNTEPCSTNQPEPNCTDKFKNCPLVAQARLCSYEYYSSNCCLSCHGR